MTDIVERLRSENTLTGYYDPPQLQQDAADEIERLREALQTAVAVIENYDREVITDTIWLSNNETLVDYLRAAGGGQP